MPIPALLAAAPAIMQGITGLAQMIGGKKQLNNLERPEYEIPNEVKQALAISRANYADPTMPGQQTMYDRNSLAAANAARAAIEGGGGLSSLAGISAAESTGAQNIGIAGANFQNQQELQYQQQLGNMANYKDQEWQVNKFAPYSEAYNEGRERIGAGQQNFMSALGGIAKVGLGMMQMPPGTPDAGVLGQDAVKNATQTGSINRILESMQSYWGDGSYGSKAYDIANRIGDVGGYGALKSAYDAQQAAKNANAVQFNAYQNFLDQPQ